MFTGFLAQLSSCENPPGWLLVNHFYSFCKTVKTTPILQFLSTTPSVWHVHTLAARVGRFLFPKISSWQGCTQQYWPEDTQQQESNKTVSYWQFGTTITIVTAHIRRELFWFLDDRLHSFRNSNFSHFLIHCLFIISFLYHFVILLLTGVMDSVLLEVLGLWWVKELKYRIQANYTWTNYWHFFWCHGGQYIF